MKTIITAILLLATQSAHANAFCLMDYTRSACDYTFKDVSFCSDPFSSGTNSGSLGYLCQDALWYKDHYGRCINDLTACNGNYNDTLTAALSVSADLNTCRNNYNWTEANRQQWITYGNNAYAAYKKNNALIAKLRKACGAKCKKIK